MRHHHLRQSHWPALQQPVQVQQQALLAWHLHQGQHQALQRGLLQKEMPPAQRQRAHHHPKGPWRQARQRVRALPKQPVHHHLAQRPVLVLVRARM